MLIYVCYSLSPPLSPPASLHSTSTPLSLVADVRLIGSTVHSEDQPVVGRLDIYHNGTWGTISKSGWSKSASDTVCRQLGLSFTGQVSYKTFEQTEGKVWLQGSDLMCENNSTHIRDCKVNKWDCNGCRHVNDLAIACHGKFYTPLMLKTVAFA